MTVPSRITHGTLSRTVLTNLQHSLGRMERLQGQLSSGKAVSRPSDSPVATVSALQYRADVRRTEQLSRNASDALDWLGTADTTLTASLGLVGRARELVLQGMTATSDAEARAALAAEIDGLRENLVSLANASYLDRPIFAGTSNTTVAYGPAGNYQGTAPGPGAMVLRTVAPGVQVPVNLTGPEVFGGTPTGSPQLFAVLEGISAKLKANDGNLAADLGNLDVARLNVQNRLSEVGSRYNRVETLRARAEDNLITMRTGLSEVEDIDLPKTLIEVQMQEVAYQAALNAGARVVQPSLLDFLR